MSGTSADGIDVALIEIAEEGASARPRLLSAHTQKLDDHLHSRIVELISLASPSIDLAGETDALLGDAIGHAINDFVERERIDPTRIRAIGCHGQTIRHRPTGRAPFTMQIGDPNRIVERTGLPVVADFRRRDMAAGGQGAPLLPAYHELLFRDADEYRLVLNIGGIANFTCLPAHLDSPILGFDTGPGNTLLDAWIQAQRGLTKDTDGEWARGAEVDQALLLRMLSDPYFSEPPPKSTGREHFHLAWVEQHLEGRAPSAQVVQSTLTELTAASVLDAAKRYAPEAARIIVCGGGRRNLELMKRLQRRAPMPVQSSESFEVDGDFIEAAAFAWFAKCSLESVPVSRASVTGASGNRVLGGVYSA